MPPKYFAYIDGEQKGPFSLDQLADAGVRPSTYVWSKDMADWQRADQVDEIRNAFKRHIEIRKEVTPEPPVTPQYTPTDEQPADGQDRPRFTGRFHLPEVEEQTDINRPPQVSMTLAVLSLLLCFPPTGIAAVIYTYKAVKTWEEATKWGNGVKDNSEELKRKAHDYERLSKMWLGLTVAFGVIFWTLLFSVR